MDRLNPRASFVERSNMPLFGISGMAYRVRTDAGSIVKGRVADRRYTEQDVNRDLHYFCHGHSLGTFTEFGYTVFSGPDLQTVLNDEYREVDGSEMRAGDLMVWFNAYNDRFHPDHSAIVSSIGESNGRLDAETTMVSSKNGGYVPPRIQTLSQVTSVYGNDISAYRRK